MVDIVIW